MIEPKTRREQIWFVCVLVSISNDLLEGTCTIRGAQYRLKKFLGIDLTNKEVKQIHEDIRTWPNDSAVSGSKSSSTLPEQANKK